MKRPPPPNMDGGGLFPFSASHQRPHIPRPDRVIRLPMHGTLDVLKVDPYLGGGGNPVCKNVSIFCDFLLRFVSI